MGKGLEKWKFGHCRLMVLPYIHELLTVKSDDVEGRSKVYNSIVRRQVPEFSTPESFNVMIKELQGLCIDVELD